MTDAAISRIASLIGMSRRAGFLIIGSDAVITAIQKRKPYIALVASDVSERTNKQLCDKCLSHSVKLVHLPMTRYDLAKAAGKEAPLATVAVTDQGLAKAILKLFDAE